MSGPEQPGRRRFRISRSGVVLAGFLAIAGYFLWTEHQAHFIAALPWVLIGGCLVMHLFMHGGHSGQGGGSDASNDAEPGRDNRRE